MRWSIWIGAALMLSACDTGTESVATAPTPGEIAAGRDFSQKWCTGCHIVGPGIRGGTVGPSFEDVARRPERTRESLTRWTVDPHPPMPDLDIKPADSAAVAAYILSLRE